MSNPLVPSVLSELLTVAHTSGGRLEKPRHIQLGQVDAIEAIPCASPMSVLQAEGLCMFLGSKFFNKCLFDVVLDL